MPHPNESPASVPHYTMIRPLSNIQRLGVLMTVFISGMAALIYQVLWLKQLGLLFGNTAQAAASTLSVFFLGLSAGSYFWGRKECSKTHPLRTYSLLEIGIAISALLYFFLFFVYREIYPHLVAPILHHPPLVLLVKFILALIILFPPAFFMGGTFPVVVQAMTHRRDHLARAGTILYATNTFGATLGAFAAGYILPLSFGFKNSYWIAIACSLIAAIIAFLIGVGTKSLTVPMIATSIPKPTSKPDRLIGSIAFFSGAITLGLEVLWTKMFSLVLQNSVYSFTIVLMTFLLALAIGAFLAHLLAIPRWNAQRVLGGLLLFAGFGAALSPLLFSRLTGGVNQMNVEHLPVGMVIFFAMLLPAIAMGTVFPFLLKLVEKQHDDAPQVVGRLAAINTGGAIVGSLLAGFVLMSVFGLWNSIRLLAAMYFIFVFFLPDCRYLSRTLSGSGYLLLAILALNRPALVELDAGERVLKTWQGSGGVVSVVESSAGHRDMRLNNYYSLGGTEKSLRRRRQGMLPLILHPDPKDVFYLGMGTGITAGGALDFPVERVVVCEINPQVIAGAREFFAEYSNELFDDSRVDVLIEDGRNYLMGTEETFDVIVSDLFVPWNAGIGNLYSIDQYRLACKRLNPGGLYAQWLPAGQISRREFDIIAKTMLEVFPSVTLWRGDFSDRYPILMLLGSMDNAPLDPDGIATRLDALSLQHKAQNTAMISATPYVYYCGNLSEHAYLFDSTSVNTDDRPLIEYLAAQTQTHENSQGERIWLIRDNLNQLTRTLLSENGNLSNDPYLTKINQRQRELILAGLNISEWNIYEKSGDGDTEAIEKKIQSTFEKANIKIELQPGASDIYKSPLW